MGSLDSLQSRSLLASGTVINAGTDQPVCIRVRYIGSGTPTSVTVTTATNIVLVDSATTDTVAFATDTTVGAVVDKINATGRWEAKILDARRSQASASTMVQEAITASNDENGVQVWNVKKDTSTTPFLVAVCLSPKRNFLSPDGHRVKLQEIVYLIDGTTGPGADNVQVFKRKATLGGGTEAQVLSVTSVDDTLTTISFASGNGEITGKNDEEILVLVKDASGIADATKNFVRVVGIVE